MVTHDEMQLPLLKFLGDKKQYSFSECKEYIISHFNLSKEEQNQLTKTGQEIIANRVGWARTYLKQAGLVYYPKRGVMEITEEGIKLLASNPNEITLEMLKKYPSFTDFMSRQGTRKKKEKTEGDFRTSQTPEEVIENSYISYRNALIEDLIEQVKTMSPAFFERLVVELLVKMGYGGSVEDAGEAIGKSGDEGIDGIIKEDKLGLDVIYIQAKRWEAQVGRPEIQKFMGALSGQRARKGVFITTSIFSTNAHEYCKNVDAKIVLIDGLKLANLMIDYDLGVSKTISYELKKVDSDFFSEE